MINELIKNSKNEKIFKEYWDKHKNDFDWHRYAFALCKFCNKYFDIWWDPEKMPKLDYFMLAKHCYKHFEKWWDPDKFLDVYYHLLCVYCEKHFKIWYNPKRIKWDTIFLEALKKYCSKYKHIWEKDYIKMKIKGGE